MLNLDTRVAKQEYPFQHFIARGLLNRVQLSELTANAPTTFATTIAVDDPSYEKHYRMNLISLVEGDKDNDVGMLPNNWADLLDELRSDRFTSWLSAAADVPLAGLLRSIGLYVHRNGDFLTVHKDKPTKAITAILYLNTDWPADAGGRFQCFTDGSRDAIPVVEVMPVGGQLLAFSPTADSWHSVSKVAHPAAEERITVQLEYWLSTELMGSAYKGPVTR
jgi:Rps23 Pro-64 3,4-dihydroxylase Tpa1-like proline 4-hydroxylase